jgi:hypothetical protein
MKTKSMLPLPTAEEIIKQIVDKYGEEPIISKKGKKIKQELTNKKSKDLAA